MWPLSANLEPTAILSWPIWLLSRNLYCKPQILSSSSSLQQNDSIQFQLLKTASNIFIGLSACLTVPQTYLNRFCQIDKGSKPKGTTLPLSFPWESWLMCPWLRMPPLGILFAVTAWTVCYVGLTVKLKNKFNTNCTELQNGEDRTSKLPLKVTR